MGYQLTRGGARYAQEVAHRVRGLMHLCTIVSEKSLQAEILVSCMNVYSAECRLTLGWRTFDPVLRDSDPVYREWLVPLSISAKATEGVEVA